MSTTEAGPSGTSEHREGMLPVVESIDVSQREDLHKLRGRSVGLMGVLFLTVTGAAPISAMLFNTPIAVGFGNGIGAPAGFLVATIVLTVFSVGYVAMSRKVTAAGGFYSFISHGLNRELGMASGFAMVAAYSVFEVSLVGGFAYFASLKAAHYGWHVQWYWCGLFMIALICVLAYLDVRVSARILGVALLFEVITLVVFDLVIFTQASGNVSASAINPINAFKSLGAGHAGGTAIAAGAAGIGIFFAFWSWVGFEMAPNYGEESHDPKKTVPRAMYISVIGLGIFYTITSWAGVSGYHSIDSAAYVAQNQNESSNVRNTAFRRVTSRQNLSTDNLIKLYDATDNRSMRNSIVDALAQRPESAALEKLLNIVKYSTDVEVRSNAIRELLGKNDKAITQKVLDLIKP